VSALEGQLLTPSDRGPDVWLDVLAGGFVRLELRESTLPPEPGTEQVWTAADGPGVPPEWAAQWARQADELNARIRANRIPSETWTGVWG